MTRLALGASCGKPGRGPMGSFARGPGGVGDASARSCFSSDQSAAVPMPVATRPNSARRVMCLRFSASGFIARSLLGNGLVEVQDRRADAGVGGVFDGVERFVAHRL